MLLLRGYQGRLKTKVYEAWKKVLSVLLVLATGGGKTVTFASLMLEHEENILRNLESHSLTPGRCAVL
jgi:superfamily II DNA or RNA helicase